MSEISFKDLAKLIHPDTNPDIENPSEKMTLALRNRGDKKALWNLAVQWGVVEGEMNADATAVTGDAHIRVETGGRYGGFDPQGNPFTGRGWSTGSPSQGADAGLTQIRVNDVVQFYAQRASHHAVVVDIIVNEFAVVFRVYCRGTIFDIHRRNAYSGESFRRMYAANSNMVNEAQLAYLELLRAQHAQAQPHTDPWEVPPEPQPEPQPEPEPVQSPRGTSTIPKGSFWSKLTGLWK